MVDNPKFKIGLMILCVGIGAFALAAYEIGSAYKCIGAKNWPRVAGQITQSRIVRHYSGGRRRRQLYFDYRYTFHVESYAGDQVNHGSIEGMSADYIVNKYPQGSQVLIHVNPKYPKDSVIEPEYKASAAMLFGVSIVALILVGSSPWLLKGFDLDKNREQRLRQSMGKRDGFEEEEFDYEAYVASLSK